MNKLNFGCGSIQPSGWVNVDRDITFAQENKELHTSTLQLPDNHFDIIVAHAVVQQFEWHRLVQELVELRRILKPEGVLRISLPDIERGFKAYQDNNIEWFPNSESDIESRFSAWLTWYSTSITLLTDAALARKLVQAGFSEVRPSAFQDSQSKYPDETCSLDTREGEFFFVEAFK